MRLTFLGKESVPDQSPTLYATDGDSIVVQGWIVIDAQILAAITVSDQETLVEVPPKLMVHLEVYAKPHIFSETPYIY